MVHKIQFNVTGGVWSSFGKTEYPTRQAAWSALVEELKVCEQCAAKYEFRVVDVVKYRVEEVGLHGEWLALCDLVFDDPASAWHHVATLYGQNRMSVGISLRVIEC